MDVSYGPYGLSGLIKNDLQKDSISVMVSSEDLAHLTPMVSICQGMSTLVKQDHLLSISMDWIAQHPHEVYLVTGSS